jgi:GNAT superfamily N-acetyltransferase
MMTSAPIKVAAQSDAASVISALVLAFSTDPLARWCWPDPDEYLTHFSRFIQDYGGKAFAHKSAFYIEGYLGGALWLPPGVLPDEDAVIALVEKTVAADKQEALFGLLGKMDDYHPEGAHWYLPLIGVESIHRGKGLGSALMARALLRGDQDHLPAYLESSNPINISLYKRHGFELLDTLQIGTAPPLSPMLRTPQ